MSLQNDQADGCGTGIVVLIIGVTLLALLAPMVHAQEPWDKSSIKLDGQCLADGRAEFTVTNGGADMAGPSAVTLTTFGATSTRLLGAVCQRGVVVDFLDAPGGHVVFVVREGKAFSDNYFTVRHFSKTQRVRVCAGVVS